MTLKELESKLRINVKNMFLGNEVLPSGTESSIGLWGLLSGTTSSIGAIVFAFGTSSGIGGITVGPVFLQKADVLQLKMIRQS